MESLGGAEGFLDDLTSIAHEEGASTHGMDTLFGRKAESVCHGGMEVLGFIGLSLDIAGRCIRLADYLAALDAAPGHHDGKGLGKMIPAPAAVDLRRAPELGGKHDHGFIQHAL